MKELSIGFDVLDESIIKEFLTEIKLLRFDIFNRKKKKKKNLYIL